MLITVPNGVSLYAPETLATIAEVHATLEEQTGVANVWSLETLRRWLAEKLGKTDAATLKKYVDALPPFLVQRFIAHDQSAIVIEGRVPDKDASELLPIDNDLDKKLDRARTSHSGYEFRGNGTLGDRGPLERRHDQQAEPGLDDRVCWSPRSSASLSGPCLSRSLRFFRGFFRSSVRACCCLCSATACNSLA